MVQAGGGGLRPEAENVSGVPGRCRRAPAWQPWLLEGEGPLRQATTMQRALHLCVCATRKWCAWCAHCKGSAAVGEVRRPRR